MNNGRKTLELLEAQGEPATTTLFTWGLTGQNNLEFSGERQRTNHIRAPPNKQFSFLVESPSLYLVIQCQAAMQYKCYYYNFHNCYYYTIMKIKRACSQILLFLFLSEFVWGARCVKIMQCLPYNKDIAIVPRILH